MVEKPGKLQPALVGGAILGLGSVIPILAYANLCCCLWAIIGGAVAARMLIKRSPTFRVTNGDGAVVGMFAGLAGSVVNLVVGVPLNILYWNSLTGAMLERADTIDDTATRESFKQIVAAMQSSPLLFSLMIWAISAILAIGFATLGGVIGVALFEKRKGQPYPPQWPPPPPPGYPPPGFTPPGPPPGGPAPPPGQPPYGGGDAPPY